MDNGIRQVPWMPSSGVKYSISDFPDENRVKDVVAAVPTDFAPPEDKFVGLTRENGTTFGTVQHYEGNKKTKTFYSQNRDKYQGIVEVLKQISDFWAGIYPKKAA
jgi:hypothetical protein